MTKYTSLPSSPHAIRASPLEADAGSFKRLKERVVDVLMLPVMAIGTALYVLAMWLLERNDEAVR